MLTYICILYMYIEMHSNVYTYVVHSYSSVDVQYSPVLNVAFRGCARGRCPVFIQQRPPLSIAFTLAA